jgi:molecular chaperone DnaK (HSP70)
VARAVGIDLGTTNSVVCVLEGRRPGGGRLLTVTIPSATGQSRGCGFFRSHRQIESPTFDRSDTPIRTGGIAPLFAR